MFLLGCRQDDLIVEATPDHLVGEQTWPTEEEFGDNMNGDDNEDMEDGEDDEQMVGEDNEDGEDGEDGEEKLETIEDFMAGIKQLKETPKNGAKVAKGVRFADGEPILPDDDEAFADEDWDRLAISRKDRRRNEVETAPDMVDDYVDTPEDQSARTRFARYRSLQSFRASHWHPKANLPDQYGRIFQFDDLKGMQRRLHHQVEALRKLQVDPLIEAEAHQKKAAKGSQGRSRSGSMQLMDMDDDMGDTMSVGAASTMTTGTTMALTLGDAEDYIRTDQRVTIELADVPAAVVSTYQRQGYLVMYALHSYEYKLSVLHYQIRRVNPVLNRETGEIAEEAIVKSKDLLLFHVSLF